MVQAVVTLALAPMLDVTVAAEATWVAATPRTAAARRRAIFMELYSLIESFDPGCELLW
jgi:hypothetical protein